MIRPVPVASPPPEPETPGSVAAASAAGIVLAGGRARRLDGADKPGLVVDGAPLVEHALTALAGCAPLVLVGPDSLARPGTVVVREDPPFGGPVAALAAALPAVDNDLTWLLACDLPRAAAAVSALEQDLHREPLRPEEDGLVLVDGQGQEQWLAGLYRRASLERALAGLPRAEGARLRDLAAALHLRRVPDRRHASLDLDTWDQVSAYTGRDLRPATGESPEPSTEEDHRAP